MSNAAPIYPTEFGTPRSGLLLLRNAVAAYFEDFGVGAVVAPVGLKYRSFNFNRGPDSANRVVFIPGEFDGSLSPRPRRYGALSRASRNHAQVINPRELANWDRPFTISCWSAPAASDPRDESAALELAENLIEQVVRAVHAAGRADIVWGGVLLVSPPQEAAFGVELLLSATQRGPLYDVTLDYTKALNGFTSDDVRMR